MYMYMLALRCRAQDLMESQVYIAAGRCWPADAGKVCRFLPRGHNLETLEALCIDRTFDDGKSRYTMVWWTHPQP
jgi:hypothetical protein